MDEISFEDLFDIKIIVESYASTRYALIYLLFSKIEQILFSFFHLTSLVSYYRFLFAYGAIRVQSVF